MTTRIRTLTREEVNRAFQEIDRQLGYVRGGAGIAAIRGDIDLKGHVVSNSGKASRSQDLITKGAVDVLVDSTTTTIINQAGASAWIRVNEPLTGTVNGTNKTFTAPYEVLGGTKIAIFDGFLRLRRVDGVPGLMEYSLSGQTVTCGAAPTTRIAADFLMPRPASPIFDETPTGAKNGSNTAFTLAYEPSAASDVTLFSGGGVMERVEVAPLPPDQYVIQGQTITTGWAPLSTDDFKADYPIKELGPFRWGDELTRVSSTVYELDEEPLGDKISVYRSQIRLSRVTTPSNSLEYSISGKRVTMTTVTDGEPVVANYQTPAGGEVLHAGPIWQVGSEILDVMIATFVDLQFVTGASASAASGVTSLNALTGAVTLAAGTNITLTPAGNTITIAATGGGYPGALGHARV